jgi:hypothetical protein
MGKPRVKPNYRRRVLRLPDPDHCKTAVLNSLGSPASRRVYEYAIDQFIAWYCSEPRLAFNRIVVVRYRTFASGARVPAELRVWLSPMRPPNRGLRGSHHDENIAPYFFRNLCLASRARQRPTEAGVFEDELHLEIGVSDPVGVQGGTRELEEVRTSAWLEWQGKNGCRDFSAMICEEDKGNVAVASVYGLVKCFGPKNCHASVDGSTLTALLSEPGLERQSGINLFKEFDEMQAESKNHQMVLNW